MRRIVLALLLFAAAAPAAAATPGTGVSGVVLKQVTVGDTDYVLREVTIQPGGHTGWHYHRGTLYAFVRAGTLSHLNSDCSVTVHPRGQAFVEPSGPENVHLGRNPGPGAVVLEVLYVNPAGSALSEDAPAPPCASSS